MKNNYLAICGFVFTLMTSLNSSSLHAQANPEAFCGDLKRIIQEIESEGGGIKGQKYQPPTGYGILGESWDAQFNIWPFGGNACSVRHDNKSMSYSCYSRRVDSTDAAKDLAEKMQREISTCLGRSVKLRRNETTTRISKNSGKKSDTFFALKGNLKIPSTKWLDGISLDVEAYTQTITLPNGQLENVDHNLSLSISGDR